MTEEIMSLVNKHEQWRLKETINLIPSENVTSPAVKALLSSDFGHRYTSPDRFYMGTKFIDNIQQYGEQLAKDLFNCDTADLRPLSGHIADLIFLACFTKPKDKVICVSREKGGYPGISNKGVSSTLCLKVLDFPFSEAKMSLPHRAAAASRWLPSTRILSGW